jgi:hypothetical protein
MASMAIVANNPWRMLAKDLGGLQYTGDVVRIPNLSEVLKNPTRYSYDQKPFQNWVIQYYPSPITLYDVYPEWRFNNEVAGGFTKEGRNSFLCIYAKLEHEDLWSEVKTVFWVGRTGEMLFVPDKKSEELRNSLVKQGYGDWWHAQDCGDVWGVRSPLRGTQLHFREPKDPKGVINVHIDLHNPGVRKGIPSPEDINYAARHLILDKTERPKTHVWSKLREALEQQDVDLPPKSN